MAFCTWRTSALVSLLFAASLTNASAQLADRNEGDVEIPLGEPEVRRFRVGAEITAQNGACKNLLAMVAVPWEGAEQSAKIIAEDISPEVKKVEYRELKTGSVRQMLVHVPYLTRGQTAHAIVSFEVTTRPILPPDSTDVLAVPERPKGPLKQYLGASPYIETRHRSVRNAAKDALASLPKDAAAWEQVHAIYNYVQENVQYEEGPDQSAIHTLKKGKGDCQAISATFIAMCRANKIPARMVWVENHCYPEFYLEDAGGNGRWYPCESAGEDRAFGEMPRTPIIFQKGDNFRIPERPKDRLRYASDWARGLPGPGGGKPKIKFIRERE